LDIGLTKEELEIFLQSFHKHKLTEFGRSIYRDKTKGHEGIDIDRFINKILETAELLNSSKLKAYFIAAAYQDVLEWNKSPFWTIARKRFQQNFGARQMTLPEATYPKKFTVFEYALYCYYSDQIREPGVEKAYQKIASEIDTTKGNFKKEYLKASNFKKRTDINNIRRLEKIRPMLIEYPEGLQKLEDELNTMKAKKPK